MSYHLGRFSQADWFYGKETPAPAGAPAPSAGSTSPPAPVSTPSPAPPVPAPSAPVTTSAPAPEMDYEEGGGLNMYMIAGISALVLAGILIYFKFSSGSDETVYEEVEEVSSEADAEPEPEKKKGKTITVEIQTDDE